jgi:hypothetical protein
MFVLVPQRLARRSGPTGSRACDDHNVPGCRSVSVDYQHRGRVSGYRNTSASPHEQPPAGQNPQSHEHGCTRPHSAEGQHVRARRLTDSRPAAPEPHAGDQQPDQSFGRRTHNGCNGSRSQARRRDHQSTANPASVASAKGREQQHPQVRGAVNGVGNPAEPATASAGTPARQALPRPPAPLRPQRPEPPRAGTRPRTKTARRLTAAAPAPMMNRARACARNHPAEQGSARSTMRLLRVRLSPARQPHAATAAATRWQGQPAARLPAGAGIDRRKVAATRVNAATVPTRGFRPASRQSANLTN